MTPKQYLRQIAELQHRIDTLTEEIEERRTRLTSTAAPALGDKVQTSSRGDSFATAMAVLADKDLQRQELIYIYEQLRDTIVDQILELENVSQSKVLYERYVHCKRWDVIAEEMNYSIQRIFQLHGNALVAFAMKFKL